MNDVFLTNKKEGETPLFCLEKLRQRKKIPKDVPMTYAGRLDPMASGKLLILVGEKVKEKEKYLGLDKEYEFEVLFGFATDTHDILGKVTGYSLEFLDKKILTKKIKENLGFFKAKIKQKYPMYSSKTVAGKQLWQYARGGEEIEVPEREVEVKSLKLLKIKRVNSSSILQNTEMRIKKVKGDFRQKEILKIWQEKLGQGKKQYYIARFKIKCSSGTYVRVVANELGQKIGIPALAYSIKRTKILGVL